jgi:hypothetical protein
MEMICFRLHPHFEYRINRFQSYQFGPVDSSRLSGFRLIFLARQTIKFSFEFLKCNYGLDKINIRRIKSLTALLSFILLTITVVVLYIEPQGRVAYWADWHL